MSDLLEAPDRGVVRVLLLLDLSAAFNTVDHETLLRRLELTIGVSGNALAGWHPIYLDVSTSFDLERTVPNYSSCLQVCQKGHRSGTTFFIMYTMDLVELSRSQNLQPHLYIYISLFTEARQTITHNK